METSTIKSKYSPLTWDEALAEWERDCTDEEAKKSAINGMRKLKELFPQIIDGHPLLYDCLNKARWMAQNIEKRSKVIDFFAKDKKRKWLLSRLNNRATFLDCLIELELKFALSQKFESIFDVIHNGREVDAVVKIDNRLVFCEITRQYPSQKNQEITTKFHEFSSFFV